MLPDTFDIFVWIPEDYYFIKLFTGENTPTLFIMSGNKQELVAPHDLDHEI